MDRLKAKNIEVYRTDESGTVVATSNGKTVTFNTKPGSYTGIAGSSGGSSTGNSSSNGGGTSTPAPASKPPVATTPAPNNSGDRTVYWVPNGKSYHFTKDCLTLARSKTINEGLLSSCPKSDPCDKCTN